MILTSKRVKFNPEALAQKLKENYVPTLAEMESTAFLVRQGFEVTVEPCAPEKALTFVRTRMRSHILSR